jgi:hypothetical protein
MATKALIQQSRKEMQKGELSAGPAFWKALAEVVPAYPEEKKNAVHSEVFVCDLTVLTQLTWDLVAITVGEKPLADPKHYAAFISAIPSFPAGVIDDLQEVLLVFFTEYGPDVIDSSKQLLAYLVKSPIIDTVPGVRNLVLRMIWLALYESNNTKPSPYQCHEKDNLLSLVEHEVSLKLHYAD